MNQALRQVEEQVSLCDREEELLQAAWDHRVPNAIDPKHFRLFRVDVDAYFRQLTEEFTLRWTELVGDAFIFPFFLFFFEFF